MGRAQELKILVDTNILISAMLYPKFRPATALCHAADNHELVLSDYNITDEAPRKLIADPKDAPILNAAILADVDVIVSGDKHFLSLSLERPKVIIF
ncbi:MAG: hypothetical protein LBR98_10260 [Syntrophomonadaceae bacterium]|nr:hypothetical protein [Syntrophomonadaceae bacterium]